MLLGFWFSPSYIPTHIKKSLRRVINPLNYQAFHKDSQVILLKRVATDSVSNRA